MVYVEKSLYEIQSLTPNYHLQVIGIVLVAIGAIIHHELEDFKAFFGKCLNLKNKYGNTNDFLYFAITDDFFNAPTLMLIIVGGIAFVAAIFGYCGVCYESKCMLYIVNNFRMTNFCFSALIILI